MIVAYSSSVIAASRRRNIRMRRCGVGRTNWFWAPGLFPTKPGASPGRRRRSSTICTRTRGKRRTSSRICDCATKPGSRMCKALAHSCPASYASGPGAETVSVLSRYQDSTYVGGRPTTWKTKIERAGRYEVRVKREEEAWWEGPATIYLSRNGVTQAKDLAPGSDHAFFDLPSGDAELDVWAQAPGSSRRS